MMESQKAFARRLYAQVMESVDVPSAMRRSVSCADGVLRVDGREIDLRAFRRVMVLAMGKAAVPMAQYVIDVVGSACAMEGIVVGPGQWSPHSGIRFLRGDHPVPYKNSFAAAEQILGLARTADKETLALYLISGGASAMVEAPLDPSIGPEDMSQLYERILHSGLPIEEMNALRKHFSAVKGGRLALASGAATRCTLLISDVPPGKLDVVSSGPSLPDSSTVEGCRELLAMTPAFDSLPTSLLNFAARMPETPKTLPEGCLPSVCVSLLSSESLTAAAEHLAKEAGYRVVIDNACDDWDYCEAASYLVERARAESESCVPICILSAGEVTVSIHGEVGIGGRNLQWALEVARLLSGMPGHTAMSAGSDGVDGNSPAAGAIVDGTTWQRAKEAGIDPEEALQRFNAYPLFAALGDDLTPGPSGNNIRDLRAIFVRRVQSHPPRLCVPN